MTPTELILRGRILYGANWKKQLAYNLGVTEQAVGNWATGRTKIRKKHETKIHELLTRRGNVIRVLLKQPKDGSETFTQLKV